ncbi:MAG: 16S rRNA (adenine(1518)-N(6)/adenine(1519)-N(6))-dimethyltransferase RsmA [Geminicoccaceae bacterium]
MVRRHGLAADHRLGQHFLFDPTILDRIAQAATPLDAGIVVEIGPGPGGLTAALLKAGARRLVAVERDRRCIEALTELVTLADGRLELVAADAMDFDLAVVAQGQPVRIVANLPYNIGTALLLGWLGRLDLVEVMVLMFQKEVALRLVASPGSDDYGRLAVLAQSLCRVERLFDLPAGAFHPPPKVASSVVRLTPLPDRPGPELTRALERVTAAAFGQRRKMLRSSLKSLGVPLDRLLAGTGVEPTRRAEELSIPTFQALAANLVGPPV